MLKCDSSDIINNKQLRLQQQIQIKSKKQKIGLIYGIIINLSVESALQKISYTRWLIRTTGPLGAGTPKGKHQLFFYKIRISTCLCKYNLPAA